MAEQVKVDLIERLRPLPHCQYSNIAAEKMQLSIVLVENEHFTQGRVCGRTDISEAGLSMRVSDVVDFNSHC